MLIMSKIVHRARRVVHALISQHSTTRQAQTLLLLPHKTPRSPTSDINPTPAQQNPTTTQTAEELCSGTCRHAIHTTMATPSTGTPVTSKMPTVVLSIGTNGILRSALLFVNTSLLRPVFSWWAAAMLVTFQFYPNSLPPLQFQMCGKT